jgi:hypothetical protein
MISVSENFLVVSEWFFFQIRYVPSYEANFIQGLLKKNEKKLARFFNFTFRYTDNVLSLNNSKFDDFVDRI